MNNESKARRFNFNNFTLDLEKRLLLRDGEPVPLTPKAFDTLALLVRRSGRVVSKDELLEEIWAAAFVVFDKSPMTIVEAGIQWTPDGHVLTFIDNRDGVSNIWLQPLDGGPAKQLTNFTPETIFRFAWSPDGKMFVAERGTEIGDIVLINK